MSAEVDVDGQADFEGFVSNLESFESGQHGQASQTTLTGGRQKYEQQSGRTCRARSVKFGIDGIARAASATRKFGFLGRLGRIIREAAGKEENQVGERRMRECRIRIFGIRKGSYCKLSFQKYGTLDVEIDVG